MSKKVVLIIGTGTIGEPLIALFARLRTELGVDEVYFHKQNYVSTDCTKVMQLLKSGAKLCVASRRVQAEFESKNIQVDGIVNDALEKATVVIDCTPSGVGVRNKEQFYQLYVKNTKGFIAQGTEQCFGKPYAYGINDEAITADDQFLQVVSCNTHNIAVLLKTLGFRNNRSIVKNARFVCMRRVSDISQRMMIASPVVIPHGGEHGTHHADDVVHLFLTVGHNLLRKIHSSAIIMPTQYMHVVQFDIELKRRVDRDEILAKLEANKLIATTEKIETGTVFSFARDHSPIFGRVLNQAIIPVNALRVRGRRITGFSFTSQDGNSLLSSIVAAERYIYPTTYEEKIKCLDALVFDEL